MTTTPKNEPHDKGGHERPTYQSSCRISPKAIAEMVYDEEEGTTAFALLDGLTVVYQNSIYDTRQSKKVLPYEASNPLLTTHLVRLPSQAVQYRNEEQLLNDITNFIHCYCDLSPVFEAIAAHYVMFSWVYDGFNEVPYLRVIADFGKGKSRFLTTVGSLCYKPIFATGATSTSSIFRTLEAFRGTLVLDEADFRFSNEQSEMVKILNSGHAKGMPVLRSETTKDGQFIPTAFNVFGPKIVGSRSFYDDKALESRFIVEELGFRPVRSDIPTSLPSNFHTEALALRNQLLTYRLQNWNKVAANQSLARPEL